MRTFEVHQDYWVNLLMLLDKKSLSFQADLPIERKRDYSTLPD